jgi:hypothetical protein
MYLLEFRDFFKEHIETFNEKDLDIWTNELIYTMLICLEKVLKNIAVFEQSLTGDRDLINKCLRKRFAAELRDERLRFLEMLLEDDTAFVFNLMSIA